MFSLVCKNLKTRKDRSRCEQSSNGQAGIDFMDFSFKISAVFITLKGSKSLCSFRSTSVNFNCTVLTHSMGLNTNPKTGWYLEPLVIKIVNLKPKIHSSLFCSLYFAKPKSNKINFLFPLRDIVSNAACYPIKERHQKLIFVSSKFMNGKQNGALSLEPTC